MFDLVGGGFVLKKTVNGGLTWQDVSPAPAGFLRCLFSRRRDRLGGRSQHLQDERWGSGLDKAIRRNSNTEFDSISFFDSQNGWAVGFNNLVLHTTDGGQSWLTQNVGERHRLRPSLASRQSARPRPGSQAGMVSLRGPRTLAPPGEQETIPGATDTDFEDALFLDANPDGSGETSASGSGRDNRTEPSQRDERMPRNNLQ